MHLAPTPTGRTPFVRRATTVALLSIAALAGCANAPTDPATPPPDASTTPSARAPSHAPYGPPRSRPVTPLPARTREPATNAPLAAEPSALADAIAGAPVVLLGEVHDNAAQHALRADALARRVAAGARPALAFEQLDRERQADVDRARRERPRDVDWLIAQAAPRDGWDWSMYRPFVALALEHDLPIVAANLSRTDASKVIRGGFDAAFDAPTRAALGLDALPAALLAAHEREVDDGHCGLMPAAMLAPMARAQIARDAALALAIAPHAGRGVVLLTGNGHARRDLGVPRWLPPELRARTLSIGLIERPALASVAAGAFDRVIATDGAARGDPCESLRARGAPGGAGR